MKYLERGLLMEVQTSRNYAQDFARLQATMGLDDLGEWVGGVSYESDYLTVINLQAEGGEALSQAS
jgi:hypothetical protein